MSDMKNYKYTRHQEGFVSIIVTMFIMIVLTLIVLGFAQLARREVRQSLDRQLSTQALFAAESGVNDAVNAIKSGTFTGELDTCADSTSGANAAIFHSSLGSNVSYSCLLLKQKQETLLYDSVSTDSSTYVPVDASASLTSITIGWGRTAAAGAGNNAKALSTKFPPIGGWTGTGLGVLRMDIVPAGNLDPVALMNNTIQNKTFFLYPSGAPDPGGSIAIGSANGTIVGGKCNVPGGLTSEPCNVTITGLSGTKYFIRLKSIYQPSSVAICANLCPVVSPTLLSGAQLSIDVTGKAQDVIKRISVRAPAPVTNSSSGSLPEFPLDSMSSICKYLTVMPDPALASGIANGSTFGGC